MSGPWGTLCRVVRTLQKWWWGLAAVGLLSGCTLDFGSLGPEHVGEGGVLSPSESPAAAVPGVAPSAPSSGRQPPGTLASPPVPSATSSPTAGAVDRLAGIRQQLAALRSQERPRGTLGYQRDAFGPSWQDIDGNGCNQRDDVLLRDAVPGSTRVGQQGRCDHDVLAGAFVDPYSGRQHVLDDLKDPSQSQAVQIDHVVPLAEAWVSGASAWDAERRALFANDLDNLLAVDGPTNASKSAWDPAAWRPRKGYQCSYATRWIRVKHHWDLAADPSEVAALGEMLERC